MAPGGQNVIALKISNARVGRAPVPRVEQIGEDLGKMLDDRLRRVFKTMVSSLVLQVEVRKLSHVLETVPVPAMLGIVRAANEPSAALVHISNELLFHLVDLRLGGDPQATPVPAARTITAIDCELCRDVIDVAMQALTAAVNLNMGTEAEHRLELDRFEQHAPMARIAPEHSDVLSLQIALNIGEATRAGDMEIVVPLALLDGFRAGAPKKTVERPVDHVDLWASRMSRAALGAPLPLRTVLHRMEVDIAALRDWRPGDILPIPGRSREDVGLELADRPDAPIAVGRLGALEGRKAIKLSDPPDADLLAQIRAATRR
ncbi:MAG: flagellar motor switch protein FliM [Pseudomonadota bacterium]